MPGLDDSKTRRRKLVLAIYAVIFIFFSFKMFFYAHNVGRFPDEMAHVSYIAYLEQEHKIIPDFRNMRTLEPQENKDNITAVKDYLQKYPGPYIFSTDFNYLGHPPLYYQLMRLAGGVKVQNGAVTVDIWRLRYFSMFIAALAMLLIFYIGYSRIRDVPVFHLLYATICVSVPMLAYVSAGVSNDTLALLGVSVATLGLLRFAEQKRNLLTYILISIGVYISVMSKLTAGLIVLLALIFYLIFTYIREKNLKFLLSRGFLVTLPVYLLGAAYFVLIHLQTGSFQPTFRTLDPQGFFASGFYVAPANRVDMDFWQYAFYYLISFLGTWTGIASHVSLIKNGALYSLNQIGLVGLLGLPLLLYLQFRRGGPDKTRMFAPIAVYFGIIVTMFWQFLRAYFEFENISGYLGGFQSRYYLCGIAGIALAVVFGANNLYGKITKERGKRLTKILFRARQAAVQIACFALVFLLLYEDFIYFLINFKDYI